MDLRFYGWVGVPTLPLEVLPGYRRWPVEALYSPMLGVLARVTLIDSWDFLLSYISSLSQRWPPIQLSLQVLSVSLSVVPLLSDIQVSPTWALLVT